MRRCKDLLLHQHEEFRDRWTVFVKELLLALGVLVLDVLRELDLCKALHGTDRCTHGVPVAHEIDRCLGRRLRRKGGDQ